MKANKLKLLTIFMFFIVIGLSCQNEEEPKEEWVTIELDLNDCAYVISVLDTLYDYKGTMDLHPVTSSSDYYIIIDEPERSFGVIFGPCNLPEEYRKEGVEIKFDCEVLNIKDWVGKTQADLPYLPVKLINAQIKK
jgi:hypothetical protein